MGWGIHWYRECGGFPARRAAYLAAAAEAAGVYLSGDEETFVYGQDGELVPLSQRFAKPAGGSFSLGVGRNGPVKITEAPAILEGKDSKAKATAYHIETIDVMEPSREFRPWTSGFPKADQSQDGSGTMLARFLSGIKPEHRWTEPDTGSFSLGACRPRLRGALDRADAPPEYRRRAVEVARRRLVEIERRHRARVAAEGVGRAEALGMFLERRNAEADKRRPDSQRPPSSPRSPRRPEGSLPSRAGSPDCRRYAEKGLSITR